MSKLSDYGADVVIGVGSGFTPLLMNLAAGLSKEKLSHQEVLEVAKRAAADFERLLRAACTS